MYTEFLKDMVSTLPYLFVCIMGMDRGVVKTTEKECYKGKSKSITVNIKLNELDNEL